MRKLLLVVAAASSTILALEAIGWVWERAQARGPFAWELVASRRMRWLTFDEPDAGFTIMKPGMSYEWLGVNVTVNSAGLRGAEFPLEKDPTTYRILNLGDSVAMGWAVQLEETYGKRLENYLRSFGRRSEVINAAVPGWNLENAAAFYRARGRAYQPDLVLLEITLVNDIYGQNALVAHQRPPLIEWLRINTHFWPFLASMARAAQGEVAGEQPRSVLVAPDDAASYFPTDCQDEAYDRVWSAVLDIDEQVRSAGSELTLILIPLELQVTDETFSRAAQECLEARAAQSDIRIVDLYLAYREACLSGRPEPCSNGDGYLFADTWMHPSPLGHDLIARELAQIL